MFVQKLLVTGKGQCNSLPKLYLILAEEIGAEAHLALSPNHSYIKFPDDEGNWHNIELTNNMLTTDAFILNSGYVKAEAIQKAEGASWDNEEWSEELRAEIAALNREVEVAVRKREESYLAQVRNQSSWSGIAARLSPLTSFNMAAYDLAADGMEQERRFVAALQGYSQVWGAYVEGRETAWRDLVEHRRDQGEQDGRLQRALKFGDYPRFKFEYMSFADRLELIWLDVLLLLMWAAFFFMASYISFLRYNIH